MFHTQRRTRDFKPSTQFEEELNCPLKIEKSPQETSVKQYEKTEIKKNIWVENFESLSQILFVYQARIKNFCC